MLGAVLLFGAFKYEDLYSVRNYVVSGAVFLFGALGAPRTFEVNGNGP